MKKILFYFKKYKSLYQVLKGMFLLYEKYNYTARCLYIEGIYLLFSLFFPVITLGAPLETKINGKVTN